MRQRDVGSQLKEVGVLNMKMQLLLVPVRSSLKPPPYRGCLGQQKVLKKL